MNGPLETFHVMSPFLTEMFLFIDLLIWRELKPNKEICPIVCFRKHPVRNPEEAISDTQSNVME